MNDNIISIKQLPIIEQQLQVIKKDITDKANTALSLVCTEETIKEIKKIRAELNKESAAWEKRRKEVKAAIMQPYEKFEFVYKDCILEPYKNADNELKNRISEIENELKDNKSAEVRAYFEEYAKAKSIDFVPFEKANINVTLSASMKSLKAQAQTFLDRICEDLNLIETQENADEIFYEYKQSLNVSNAITTVVNRHKAIEEAKAKEEERKTIEQATEAATAKVEAIAPPTVENLAPPVEEEKILTLRFTVRGTLTKLRELKEYLKRNGYDYE